MYCREPIGSCVYDGTCYECAVRLLSTFPETIVAKRVEIVRKEQGDTVADKLRLDVILAWSQ